MSSDGSVLRDQKVEVLVPFLAPHQPPPPRAVPRAQSAIDLPMRLPALLRAWDWFGICAIGVLVDFTIGQPGDSRTLHDLDIVLGATLTVNYVHLARGYCLRSMHRVSAQMVKTSLAWIAAFTSLVALGYVAGRLHDFEGPWAETWFASAWLFLYATRWAEGLLLTRWQREGRMARNIAVLGTGQEAVGLARRLQARSEEAHVVGVFVDGADLPDSDDIAGDSDSLASLVTSGEVDEVIIALPHTSSNSLHQALAKLATTQVEVKVDPGLSGLGIPVQGFSSVAGIPTLILQGRPLAGWGAPLKRAEDIVLTSLVLVLVAPVLLLIALLIKLDSPGPVLFRQERTGFNNTRVLIYKFRTMYHDPNPDPSVPQAQRNDPRITRIGSILRRTSLDELPQLFNVLRGDMSLVGPRPHATAHNEKYAQLIGGYLVRHRMKPGITGWAQVNGWRGETDTIEKMQGRLEHDLFYIANWSLLLDIKVLLMTIPVVLRGTNAR